jgi:hypothetical protein
MSAETALKVLEAYRRSQGRDLGTVWPHLYDVGAVRRRLETKMRLLGLLKDGGVTDCSATQPRCGKDDPSTASRSPSPGNPGEDS